jgi:hypothetical protein
MKKTPPQQQAYDHVHNTFDGPWKIGSFACSDCGREQKTAVVFVLEHGSAHAIVHITRDAHDNDVEAVFEMTLGDFADDEAGWADNATFSVVITTKNDNWSLRFITPNLIRTDIAKVYGAMLTREEALAHPWVEDVKGICEFITQSDAFEDFMKKEP